MPPNLDLSPSLNSIASWIPLDAPEGTAALPKELSSRYISHSTVGLPLLSIISLDLIILIFLVCIAFLYKFSEINYFFTEIFISDSNDKSYNLIFILVLLFIITISSLRLFRNQLYKLSYYKKLKNILNDLKDGLTSLREIKDKTPFILHTIFIWAMYILMTYVCFFAIKETSNLTLLDGVYMTIIGGLGMIVPSQGGIGSYHLAVKTGLTGIGIAVQPALMFAFAVHTAQTLMTILFGIISSISLISSKRKKDA